MTQRWPNRSPPETSTFRCLVIKSQPVSFIMKSCEGLVMFGSFFWAVLVRHFQPPFIANFEIPLDEIHIFNWT